MKIAVLSTNAKLYSTKRLVEAIRQRGHEAVVINHALCHVLIEEESPAIMYKNKLIEGIDAVIPRIGASVTDYGSTVVRQFEMMKVFTTVKSQAIMRSRNKLRSLQILSKAGVQIPKTVFANQTKDIDKLIKLVGGPPVIIKLLEGTQGVGVVLAESSKAAKSTIEAFYGLKTNVLIQEYIAESNGADIRAFVVGNKVVAAMKRQGQPDFPSPRRQSRDGHFAFSRRESGSSSRQSLGGTSSWSGHDSVESRPDDYGSQFITWTRRHRKNNGYQRS